MDPSYDEIASKLLHDNLLLTALELHLELIEAGKELSRLKEYFSNPGNFERQAARPGDLATSIARSHSQATLDSLDISRMSEDDVEKGAVDERVAVLEFELRKARESISALRANLTEAATTSESDITTLSKEKRLTSETPTLKGHEQRALNFLVNEYLLRQGFRLTAITFSEENENQDFEDWDDVGLNVPRPPELPRLYREASVRLNLDQVQTCAQACQTDDVTPPGDQDVTLDSPVHDVIEPDDDVTTEANNDIENEELRKQLEELKVQCEALQQSFDTERLNNLELQKMLSDFKASSERETTRDLVDSVRTMSVSSRDLDDRGSGSSNGTGEQFEMLDHHSGNPDQEWTKIESDKPIIESPTSCDVVEPSVPRNIPKLEHQSTRNVPEAFQQELYSLLNTNEHEILNNVDIISQLTELLPKILLSLPSNRKEELIPLISSSARVHQNSEEAAKLVSLLLSLRKRPQENERKAIISGICDLTTNQSLVENHLFAQIWDLAGVKVVEKRLLAAESCGALAPLVSDLVRKSQLLPLLQTLIMEASEEEVKISVVQNLALVVTCINDPDKYLQCEELCFLALKDSSINVQTCTIQILLPVLSQWAFQIQKLQSHLIERLLSNLSALTNDIQCIHLVNAVSNMLPYLLIYVGDCDLVTRKIENSITPLRTELQPLFQNLNNPDLFYNDNLYKPIQVLNALVTCINENLTWNELNWVIEKFISKLYDILCSLTISDENIVIAFVKLFHYVCKGFGKKFTQQYVKPIFIKGLKNFEESVSKLGGKEEITNTLQIIPVLLVSILTTGDPDDTQELSDILHQLVVSLPACNLPTFTLKVSVPHLCRAPALQEVVVTSLVDASKHSRHMVRLSAAQMLLPCLATLNENILIKHVLPALSMLSNDNDGEVREATVAIFAELLATSSCKEAQMQGRASLQAFLKDSPGNVTHTMAMALTRALATILPACDPAFREDVVLPHIHYMATFCLHGCTSQTRKIDLGLALISAVSIAMQVPLSKQAMATYLIPALRSVECVCGQCLNAHHDAVNSWLREAESKCHSSAVSSPSTPTSPTDRSVSGSQLVQSAMNSASAVGRRSVEDVRQKVTSLLRKK